MRHAILLGLLGLLPAAAARAWEPTMEVGAFAGLHLFNDDNSLGRDTFDPTSMAISHTGTFGLRVGLVLISHLTLEAELALAPSSTHDGKTSVLTIGYRGQAVVYVLTGRVRPFLLAGVGAIQSSPSNPDIFEQETLFEAHVGVGLAVDVGCHWGLRLDGRVQLEPGLKSSITEDGEILLGMYGRFGGGAEWGAHERCKPPAPPPAPPPPVDRDGDGVSDADDRCPDKAGPKENAGCPWPDTDGDGVLDKDDKCPDKPGPVDNAGCPWPDTDGDGVLDRDDRCPDKPGPVDNAGCPWPDTDGDGVLDKDDKCPDKPGPAANGGCPVPEAVKAFTGRIEGIEFAGGKSDVLKSSHKVLDQAAKVLVENPTIKLEVEGHTDNQGDHDKNVKLSQERADAVVKYLESKGVAAGRLTAKGYGPDKPVADNATAEGRTKNRRVEFRLVP